MYIVCKQRWTSYNILFNETKSKQGNTNENPKDPMLFEGIKYIT